MCKSCVRVASQAMRKEIGRFKSWFNIPQALTASENEDIKTVTFTVICSEALGGFIFTCFQSGRV